MTEARPEEEWREVPGYPQLLASSWGRIMRKPHKSGTRTYRSKPTHGVVQRMSANYSRRSYHYRGIGNVKIHRIVCLAFHGVPPSPDMEVLHGDEDSHNNTPDNLSWGTRKENLNAPGFIAYCKTRTGKDNPAAKGIANRKQEQHASTS